MANIGTLTAHIGANTAGLNTGLAQAQGRLAGFSAGAMKSIAKIGGAFAALGLAVGGLALFKNITKTGIDFEQTMTTVAGVMRATADESKRLTEAARKMGETTEWSASQAGDALQFLGMAGFEANKAIKALPGTLDLATAGQIDLGRAADIATNALTAMGLEVEELERVNDVFVGTITRSNTNMEMMAESFKYAAPVARAYGYTIEELSGLIGMMGNAGIQGSAAGTQLAMSFSLTNKVAEEFGVEGGKYVDVLERLREKGIDVTEVMKAFGMRAGRAAGVLYEATDATKEFQETLGGVQGEAKRLADAMRSTVGASFKELKSVIESLALDIFETYRDELKGFVVDTTAWIRENKDKIVGFVEGVKAFLGGVIEVISSVASLLGRLGLGFTNFFKTVESNAVDTANSIAESGEKIQEALAPDELLTWWQKFWEVLKSGWMAVGDAILVGTKFIIQSIGTLLAGLLKFILDDVIWSIMKALYVLGIMIEGLVTRDFGKVRAGFQGFKEDIEGIWTGGKETGLAAIDSWGNAWNDMVGKLKPPIPESGFIGPMPFIGPLPAPTVTPPPTVSGKPPPVITIEPPVIAMPTEGLAEFMDRVKGMIAEYETIQQNRFDWLYEHEKISSDEYLAFLEQRLSGETEYSNTWIAIQQQIENVKDGVAEADKARWQDRIAAQEEALDMLLVGYNTFWQTMLDLDMTGAERRKAIFESVARAFMDYTAQMTKDWIKNALLQKTVTEGAEKSKLAAVAAGAMGRIAWAVKEGAAAIVSAAKSIYSAAAKIFEAHAWIPFVGVAIASAFIGAMVATLAGFKKFQEGGLIGGLRWPKDTVPIMATGGEFMVREPAVRQIGVPALEYMNRTGNMPRGDTIINMEMGGFTFSGTKRADAYLIESFVEDKLVKVIEEKLKNRKLVL